MPSAATLISVLIILTLLLALLRRVRTAVVLTAYILGFVLLSSYVKQAYLDSAVTLADVNFFLLQPRENFHLFLNYPVLGISLLAVLSGFAACFWIGLRVERPIQIFERQRSGAWWRVGTAVGAVLLGSGAAFMDSSPHTQRANDGDAYVAFLTMYEQEFPAGPMSRLNLFFGHRSFAATLPPRREQVRFAVEQPEVAATGVHPDVMLVLEESTFDPRIIQRCPRELCDLAMLHPVGSAVRTEQAPLLVHTTGGGTWLTEFAVLSGLDWRVFGRGGAYAPVSLAPRLQHSLPSYLRSLGYRTVAIYPTTGNFLSARTAYEDYGFEEFYDAATLRLPTDWLAVRDGLVFDTALQAVRDHDDGRPVFVFVLTIRNHGPHGNAPQKIPPPYRQGLATTGAPLSDYLARMHDSSNAYQALATSWLNDSRPRVIAWFGDHQPEAAWEFTEHPSQLDLNRTADNVKPKQLNYLTFYQLAANFGSAAMSEQRAALDVAYLGGELLAFAGLPLDRESQAARQVAGQCNGLLLDCVDTALLRDYLSYRLYDLGGVR